MAFIHWQVFGGSMLVLSNYCALQVRIYSGLLDLRFIEAPYGYPHTGLNF